MSPNQCRRGSAAAATSTTKGSTEEFVGVCTDGSHAGARAPLSTKKPYVCGATTHLALGLDTRGEMGGSEPLSAVRSQWPFRAVAYCVKASKSAAAEAI